MRSKKSILVLAVMIISLTPAKAQNGSASTWLEVSTEHFTFVYQTEDRNGADTLVLIAEAVYDRVAAFYDSYPKHVVCVLRSDTAFANGHFSPLPPHIEIVTSAPSGPLIGAATESWIEAVFIHELGHYIHLNARDGMFGLLSTLFGPMPATLTAGFMPGWMVEGPSVFLETLLTGGGRGRNAFFEMYSRALLLEDRFFSLKRAAHSSRLPPPGRIYVAGYLLVEYLSANFGDEIFGRIAKRFARFPLFGPWRAIRQETGLSADEIFERMIDSRLEIYRRTRPVGTGTRITPDSVGDYYLPVSTDAGWILYRNQPRESRGIVHLSRGSGAITPIVDTSLTDPYSLTAERNGNRIAFAAPVSTVNDAGTQIGSSLFLHDRRSGSTTRLTDLGALRHPALSPDGSRLFAVRQEKEFASLIEVDMGTGAQSLVLRIAGTNLFTPFVSDDSASVLFVTNIRGKQDIAQIDIDLPRFPMVRDMGDAWNADRITYLTDTVAAEYYPRQSGNYLVYGSDANGLLELYQLDLRSGVISLLVTDPVGAFAGFIDEASIIYASYSHTGWIVKRSEYDPKAIIRRGGRRGGQRGDEDAGQGANQGPERPLGETFGTEAEVSEVTGASERSGSSTVPARYRDTPRLAFWLPLPLVPDPLRSGPPVIGLGALFYFASPVNDHTISLDIGTRPGVWQPIVDLEIDLTFGRQQFDIAVQHLYRENGDGSAIETLALGVDHFIQIASYTRFPDTNTLLLGWGSSYSLSVRGLEGTLPFAGTAQNHFLRLSAVGAVRLARLGADTMAVAPLSVSASIRSDFVIVKPFDLYPRSRTRLNLGATMPIASSRNIVGINIDAGFRTAPDRVPSAEAGGVFAPDIGERIVDALFGLRYYSPVAVIDRPLPFGYHLESLRGELFAEAYASALPGISFEQTLYFGAEFEIGFGKTAHLPFGLGIVFRIPLDDVFTPADDIRIYVSSSSILGAFNSK